MPREILRHAYLVIISLNNINQKNCDHHWTAKHMNAVQQGNKSRKKNK